jgi:hypothetical protein
MDPLDALDGLARRARNEAIPSTDINVAGLIDECLPEPRRFMPLAFSATLAAVAACLVLLCALRVHSASASTTTDSVSPMFAPTQVELP